MSDKLKNDKQKKGGPDVATANNDITPVSSHTPIIITDGSASIEFTAASYNQDTESNSNTAKPGENLHLVTVVSDRPHTTGGTDTICFTFLTGQQHEVEVKCRGGGGFNNFAIRGSLDVTALLPAIDFDRGEYREDPTGEFPPRNAGTGHRFGTLARRVKKLRIFRIDGGRRDLVHDCPLVASPGNAWTVNDPHMADQAEDPDHVHPEALTEEDKLQPA